MWSVSGAGARTPSTTFYIYWARSKGRMKERNHQPWGDQDGMQRYDDNWLLNPLPVSFSCLKQSQLLRGIAEEVELKEH